MLRAHSPAAWEEVVNIRSAASHPNRHASKPEAAEVWVLSASAWAVKHLLSKHSNLSRSSISTHTLAWPPAHAALWASYFPTLRLSFLIPGNPHRTVI